MSGHSLTRIIIAAGVFLSLFYLYRSPTSASSLQAKVAPQRTPSLATKGGVELGAVDDVESTFTKRIVAVGDLHGDLSHFMRILRMAQLVDMRSQWTGGKTVLVQTGDIVDRGKDTIALYRFMDSLRPQAAAAGGAVVSLVGNHELMNLMKDWRYVTAEDIATFGGERNRVEAICSLNGWISKTWRANYSITARVPYTDAFPPLTSTISSPPTTGQAFPHLHFGDRPSTAHADPFEFAAASFVHGGIQPQYIQGLKNDTPILKINEIGKDLMWSIAYSNSPMVLPRNATPEQREFWSERGPMWDRQYALEENEDAICARAEEACRLLKVRRLVMGHTPNFDGIQSRCGGTVLLIDTGISRAYGGALSALEIVLTLTPKSPALIAQTGGDAGEDEDEDEEVWVEKEVVSALYTDTRGRELIDKRERLVLLPSL